MIKITHLVIREIKNNFKTMNDELDPAEIEDAAEDEEEVLGADGLPMPKEVEEEEENEEEET